MIYERAREKFTVEGYALLDSEGIFYLSLEGEKAFKAIGQIHGSWFGVRVPMKGYLVDDDMRAHHWVKT